MIMLLSCFDLLAVLINHPLQATYSLVWPREKHDLLSTIYVFFRPANIVIAFSLLTITTMSLERYLAAAYPFFHRTSVNRTRLIMFLSFFFLIDVTLHVISFDDFLISFHHNILIFFSFTSPPLIYANYKLFRISTGIRSRGAIVPASLKSTVNLRNISTCLLLVVYLVGFSIPAFVCTICGFTGEESSINIDISPVWASTAGKMSSTFNCLIFFWKNKTLSKEGMLVLS